MALESNIAELIGEDKRTALEAIRHKLALEFEVSYGRDSATIAKELRSVIAELESLEEQSKEVDLDDELAAIRLRRQQAS